jgi:hypothetical protein
MFRIVCSEFCHRPITGKLRRARPVSAILATMGKRHASTIPPIKTVHCARRWRSYQSCITRGTKIDKARRPRMTKVRGMSWDGRGQPHSGPFPTPRARRILLIPLHGKKPHASDHGAWEGGQAGSRAVNPT